MTFEPQWMKTACALIGTKEIPGPKSSPTVLSWAAKVGSKILGIPYTDDATPWCGLFAAYVMLMGGYTPPKIAIRAKEWKNFGRPLINACPGAILVFDREGGGHVGFYVSETATHYQVLGGNQGDAVSIVSIDKERIFKVSGKVVGIRWPVEVGVDPKPGIPVRQGAAAPVSKNEA